MKSILTTLLVMAIAVVTSFGQQIPIGTANITDCGAFIVDSGYSAADYSDNEDLTTTICSDGSGDSDLINLYFTVFDLSVGDQLSIYDGSDYTAPLIGTYSGTDLQGLDITATNGAGCLTIQFTSNGDGNVGNFGAAISCGVPCAKPWAEITTDQTIPVQVCVGEEITFDGSSSSFLGGASFGGASWDFGDGNSDTSWPTSTHAFTEAGAYFVQLAVTDDNGCESVNSPDYIVYVSTTPDIQLTASADGECLGTEVDLSAVVTPTTWTNIPQADFGEPQWVPDSQAACFEHDLTFSHFLPGATITDESQVESIFVNFEHSFMGDLVITFICPNGQAIVTHQQSGGGTNLGEPVGGTDGTPGVGYDYWWAPDATNGTWAENSQSTLPSGEYEAVQPFSNLVGCPLNGTWEVEICDLWGADDGYLFDWAIIMDESLYAGVISFAPEITADCSNSDWSGDIDNTDADCYGASVTGTSAGSNDYSFEITDSYGCTYEESISVNFITGVGCNAAPIAGDDIFETDEDLSGSGDVSTNDSDPEGADLTYSVVSQPSNGTVNMNDEGLFTYTPDDDYYGTDSFTYQACDDLDQCTTATVSVTVNAVNDPPVVNNDQTEVDEDSSIEIAVLDNDNDPDGLLNTSTLTISLQPSNGTVEITDDNTLVYTPFGDFNGEDEFFYAICDDASPAPELCGTGTVTISINAVNDAPKVIDDTGVTEEDDELGVVVDVISNDSDIDGALDLGSLSITAEAENGTAVAFDDGTIRYIPNPNFYGTDEITYQICDDGSPNPSACSEGVLTIEVTGVNDGLMAENDATSTYEDESINIDVLANDTDIDGAADPNSLIIIDSPEHGEVIIEDDGTITYVPNDNYEGTDFFRYQACDDGFPTPAICDLGDVAVTIVPVNDTPIVEDDLVTCLIEESVTVDVAANDSDIEQLLDATSVTLLSAPVQGTAEVNADGTITYTANADAIGSDAVVYQICDLGAPEPILCSEGTLVILIGDDRPNPEGDYAITPEDVPVQVAVADNDSDPNGDLDLSSVSILAVQGEGVANVNNDGSITFQPASNWYGFALISYQICDAQGLCESAGLVIEVTEVNDGIQAINDVNNVLNNANAEGNVLFNDTDPDGHNFSLETGLVDEPNFGTVTMDEDGNYVYTPFEGYSGSDSFTYKICDDFDPQACDEATVTIEVINTNPNENSNPIANDDIFVMSVNGTLQGSVSLNDFDPEGDMLTVAAVPILAPEHGEVTLNAAGDFTYEPDAGFEGVDEFTYMVCETVNGNNCGIGIVSIEVVAPDLVQNMAPVAIDDIFTLYEGESITAQLTENDFDPEGILLLVSDNYATETAHGTIAISILGEFTYTPNDENWFGNDTFTYEICDNEGLCSQASVMLNVLPVNDAPVIAIVNGYTPVDGVFDGQSLVMNEDGTIDICITLEDIDGDGNVFQVENSSASHGVVSDGFSTTDACFRYEPELNYHGEDFLEITWCDDYGACASALVQIDVLPINDAPVGVVDSGSTTDQIPLDIDVLNNDYDIDGDNLTVTSILDEGNGEVVMNPDGTITYIPELGFCGEDEITYVVCDDGSPELCENVTVTITVTPADSDGDSVPDFLEGVTEDTDGDGVMNYLDTDSDGDGIPDEIEADPTTLDLCTVVVVDTDNDGIPDILDTDSDNDGIDDETEAGNGNNPVDTDGDGTPDYQDSDSDNDEIPDYAENGDDGDITDTDGDDIPDYLDEDSDNDGISDEDEAGEDATDPIDTDGDGEPDFQDTDSDGDGIDDEEEAGDGNDPVDTDGDGVPDYQDEDADNDGINDDTEGDVDTDGDGVPDYQDEDSDNDGIDDEIEGDVDTDDDGMPDYTDDDSDNDGVLDEEEAGNPEDPIDTDGDGNPDYVDEDADNDGVLDEDESDQTDCDGDGIVDSLDPDDCFTDLVIPQGFSPNGDGVGDTWVIEGLEQLYPRASVTIINRWGNEVYKALPYANDWDGNGNTSGAGTLPTGTYYYILEPNDGVTAPMQGYVYINRQ
ncbi:MAG: Ig-like domain-containing protein [Flavobacteriales bacterium]|nr:Ig-like domain-containing protein [Flavobacteriales bacterium]